MSGPSRDGKPKRATRRQLRIWAWLAGTLSFLAPWAYFGVFPKPALGQTTGASTSPGQPGATARSSGPVIIIVTKKVIYSRSPAMSSVSSGSGGVSYVPAPATAPVAISCGTHPC